MQVRVVLGTRHAPCILGDEAARSPYIQSFSTAVTLTPSRIIAVPFGLFRIAMEGMTRRLFESLRQQHTQVMAMAMEIAARPIYDQALEWYAHNLDRILLWPGMVCARWHVHCHVAFTPVVIMPHACQHSTILYHTF